MSGLRWAMGRVRRGPAAGPGGPLGPASCTRLGRTEVPLAECHSALRSRCPGDETSACDERRRGRPAFVLFYARQQAAHSVVALCAPRSHAFRCARSGARSRLGLRSPAAGLKCVAVLGGALRGAAQLARCRLRSALTHQSQACLARARSKARLAWPSNGPGHCSVGTCRHPRGQGEGLGRPGARGL